jgi:hypothetical protein
MAAAAPLTQPVAQDHLIDLGTFEAVRVRTQIDGDTSFILL